MAQQQYSTLRAALAAVPDPRHARGKHLAWTFLLGVIASALLSQQRSAAAIAQWAREHADTLGAAFHPQRQRVPSEATIRRAVRQVHVRCREAHLAQVHKRPSRASGQAGASRLPGYAVDGNYVRGAGTHGQRTLLVSLVRQCDARVLAQQAVASQQHAGKGIAPLLTGRDVRGLVLTLDAGLTDPKLAQHIRAHGGH